MKELQLELDQVKTLALSNQAKLESIECSLVELYDAIGKILFDLDNVVLDAELPVDTLIVGDQVLHENKLSTVTQINELDAIISWNDRLKDDPEFIIVPTEKLKKVLKY